METFSRKPRRICSVHGENLTGHGQPNVGTIGSAFVLDCVAKNGLRTQPSAMNDYAAREGCAPVSKAYNAFCSRVARSFSTSTLSRSTRETRARAFR